ncbi:MAG TPA: hypothetical protein VN950_23045 [Terriglobales bacterium]|nr:hypothetical protein [Terriglobales bacterium]
MKSAHCVGEDGTYSIRAHGHDMKAYRADQIDVLVAYVVPENVWYVFRELNLGRRGSRPPLGFRRSQCLPTRGRRLRSFPNW